MTVKADCHVHSRYSDHPSEWFLQRLGAAESYTTVDKIYETAMKAGMRFVTITDHNCIKGSLELVAKYPAQAFTGVEATAYFPENGCKVHILIYGLNQQQFEKIEELRTDIYRLRDYLLKENLAHSVAHATYAVNNRMTTALLEKLILLFDVFESRNGARDQSHNNGWYDILKALTPEDLRILEERHQIRPASADPWVKGFTGGSDDHAGLFIARTWTETIARSPGEFVAQLRNKHTMAGGRHSNFQALAFSIYKIAYDYSLQKSSKATRSFLAQVSSFIFEHKKLKFTDWLKLKFFQSRSENRMKVLLSELVEELQNRRTEDMDQKLSLVYGKVSQISDAFLGVLTRSLEQDMQSGNLVSVIRNISMALPGLFLSAPFITTFKHMHSNKHLLHELSENLGRRRKLHARKRILWFTDTLTDLNGVSVTLQKIARLCHEENRDLKLVTSLLPQELIKDLPPNVINLPASYSFKLPYYEKLAVKIPSLLQALKDLYDFDPDEIYISSPGPLGLLGLMIGKLLGVKCTGVYHTDFTQEVAQITGDDSVSGLVETYTRWFFSVCDTISVPTAEYQRILEKRGFEREKMKVFRRGMDTVTFAPVPHQTAKKRLKLDDGFTLLFAGRVSHDKNLDFLTEVYQRLLKKHPATNLIIAGDGPALEDLQQKLKGFDRVRFTGRIHNHELPQLYSLADLFVFPSTTDTFGMVVAEAQSCGLPAVVSDIGGPREIIDDGTTGYVLSVSSHRIWEGMISDLIRMKETHPDLYLNLRLSARNRILRLFNWKKVLEDLFEDAVYEKHNRRTAAPNAYLKNEPQPAIPA